MQEFNQDYFAQELHQIVPVYIDSTFGKIYSVTAGIIGQPLILIVHGSGPKNSCSQYHYLLQQYLVRVSYLQKFFIVAIDCPGYGNSKGSKQAVKTFPLQMFQEILKFFKYDHYFGMYGHSQGGAAIFNAVFQKPSLSEFLIMDRPVCGNISRFQKFRLPTLLIYDIQDDGHPILQGKLLYKNLFNSELHTYRNSRDPYWVPDNIWNLMLQFFIKNAKKIKTSTRRQNRSTSNQKGNSLPKFFQSKIKNEKKPKQIKKCPIPKMIQQKINEYEYEYEQVQKSSSLSQPESQRIWQQEEVFCTQIQIKKDAKVKQLIQKQLKLKQQELNSKPKPHKNEIQAQNLQKIQQKQQKNKKTQKDLSEKVIEKKQFIEEQNKQQSLLIKQKVNLSEDQCSICYQKYYYPTQTNCHHIFCYKCINQSMLINQKCPLCRAKIIKKNIKKELHQEIVKKMTNPQIAKRQNEYLRFKAMLDSIVYIVIGNSSKELQTKKSPFTKTKKKYNWQLFAKETPKLKFQQVQFNINMGQPNSKGIRVKNAPFTFQARGTFSFSCQIKIKPRNNQYSPITAIYRIQMEPGVHQKKIAIRKKIYQPKQ